MTSRLVKLLSVVSATLANHHLYQTSFLGHRGTGDHYLGVQGERHGIFGGHLGHHRRHYGGHHRHHRRHYGGLYGHLGGHNDGGHHGEHLGHQEEHQEIHLGGHLEHHVGHKEGQQEQYDVHYGDPHHHIPMYSYGYHTYGGSPYEARMDQTETRTGDTTSGRYSVDLPDGRTQVNSSTCQYCLFAFTAGGQLYCRWSRGLRG